MFHSSLDSQVIQGLPEHTISDTISESSDGATLMSLSREELSQVGAGPIREDVRVSRKKLETLILKERDDAFTGKGFIEAVMESTNTYIEWPSRMKIGEKTKKDLFVRIYGHEENEVSEAKAQIFQELGPQRDLKITLKMEISYTDHSHLISCRGATIREVMDDTGCHIHFPDSNCMSIEHKINQVTISGAVIDGVEQARSRVRELSPLIFQFNLPVIQARFDVHRNPDAHNVFIDNIQTTYNVMVTVHPPNKLQQTTIAVKGCEIDHNQVKEAVGRIINYFACDTPVSPILVESTMELTPIQLSFVRFVNDSNIHAIMMGTGAKIVFPDLSDGNIQHIKRSRIFITGELDSVYLARQQLIGCLPLQLIFDLPDPYPLEWETICQICAERNVHVYLINSSRIRSGSNSVAGSGLPPVPERGRTVQLITAERNAEDLIESRRRILGGIEQPTIARIPQTYFRRHIQPPPGHVPFAGNLAPMMLNSPNMLSPVLSPSLLPPTPFSTQFCSPHMLHLQSGHHDQSLIGTGSITPGAGHCGRPFQGLMPHKYGRDFGAGLDGRSPVGMRTPNFHGSPLAPVNLLPQFDFQQSRRAPGFEHSNAISDFFVYPPAEDDRRQNPLKDKKYLAEKANLAEGGGACHRCGVEGHFSKDCPDKKEGEGAVGHDGKPTKRYTPANFAEGEDAFQRQNTDSGTGINFSSYATIPVKSSDELTAARELSALIAAAKNEVTGLRRQVVSLEKYNKELEEDLSARIKIRRKIELQLDLERVNHTKTKLKHEHLVWLKNRYEEKLSDRATLQAELSLAKSELAKQKRQFD